MELEALSAVADQFARAGATLVLISPQLAEYNEAIAKKKNLTVDILSDPGNEVAVRYGLKYQMPDDLIAIYKRFGLNIPKHNGEASWTLPLPTTLIIDTEGIIRYADINADYTIRPEPEDTLAVLKRVVG
jgi:peroxiredoxin